MNINLKYIVLFLVCILLAGCTTYLKPEKCSLDCQWLKPIKGNVPIQVVVPENAETKYLLEHNVKHIQKVDEVYLNLNDFYKNTKELMEEVLVKSKVPLSTQSKKYLKFTISKVRWEHPLPFLMADIFLEFDIETGNGYKKHYEVSDAETTHERAMEIVTSLAVEKVFEDENVISYIESN